MSLFICDINNIMKKPQTKLGKKLATTLSRRGEEFVLISSGKEYDTYQIEITDNQVMNLLCHEYPKLAHGILINTKMSYELPSKAGANSLIEAANKANLRSTSVITAIELHGSSEAFTLHFKTFIHLRKYAGLARILDAAIDLHLQEVDEVISPYFKKINKREQ